MTDPILFTLAVLALLATPGPTNTLLMTSGATTGPASSWRLIPAEIAGYTIAILAIGFVIGPFIAESWALGMALRVCVALYLTWVATRLWRHPTAEIDSGRLIRPRDVFIATLLNPKALLFGLGIVPLHDPHAVAYMIAFCLMVAAVGASWICLGAAIRRGLLPKAGVPLVPRIGAAVITAFAGYLVLAPVL
jgi:threonine/homoserine/homoserine lactone efflux protein